MLASAPCPTSHDPEDISLCLFSRINALAKGLLILCIYIFFFINYVSLRTFTISHLFHVERKFTLKFWLEFSQCFLVKNIVLKQDCPSSWLFWFSDHRTNYGIGHKQIKRDLGAFCVWRIRPEPGGPQRPHPAGNGTNLFLGVFHEVTRGDGEE